MQLIFTVIPQYEGVITAAVAQIKERILSRNLNVTAVAAIRWSGFIAAQAATIAAHLNVTGASATVKCKESYCWCWSNK